MRTIMWPMMMGIALLVPRGAVAQDSLEYAAKFVCGAVKQPAINVAPGVYYTSLNIHNPNRDSLVFRVKFAQADTGIAGRISPWRPFTLRYDQALSLNCVNMFRALRLIGFGEGYAIIDSRLPLDVTGVYTAMGAAGLVSTEQIVRVAPRSIAAACVSSPPQPWLPDPVPIATALHGVWGPTPSDIFAVGFAGRILHYNGAAWSSQPSPVGGVATLTGVWGSSGTDVWATILSADTLLHYNGTAWSIVGPIGVTAAGTMDVSGNHSWDVFVVGGQGAISHYDGTNWFPQASGTKNDLMDVWAARDSDVFAVGRGGTILHWDGSAWTPQVSGTANDLNGVWGLSGHEVFAVGGGGTILRYNGAAWSPMTSGTLIPLNAVWGSSSCNLFAVGLRGTILHYDGTAWNPEPSGTLEPLMDIWGFPGVRAYTVGGTTASVTVRKRAL